MQENPFFFSVFMHRLKNEGSPVFDATMGSFYLAEICNLVGLYLQSKLMPLIGTNPDDDLALIHEANGLKNKVQSNLWIVASWGFKT